MQTFQVLGFCRTTVLLSSSLLRRRLLPATRDAPQQEGSTFQPSSASRLHRCFRPKSRRKPRHRHSRRQRRVFNMSSEFVAMFNGPLPADIIAALTEVFNLDDDGANATDEALLNLVGEGLVDLAGEVPMAA
ncbi:hypothetical protein BS78_05G079500 [Paspalum vaginatum]|nr:hypothetical protein BS78_05G079500 [Paspalum vaginatum]